MRLSGPPMSNKYDVLDGFEDFSFFKQEEESDEDM